MFEVLIVCPACSSYDCVIEETYWSDGDLYIPTIYCSVCDSYSDLD